MKTAPIGLFVYSRVNHTRQTVDALRANALAEESDLIVFSGSPKSDSESQKVAEVRDYIKTISGFKSVKIVERKENLGLAKSIIAGVTETVNEYGRVIVVEDDLVTSPYFLQYMNEALELYADENKVISIHSYDYPVKKDLPETFFLKGADCWGWATWKRGWDLFEPDGKKLLNELIIKNLTKEFDYNGSYPFSKMLEDQIKGKNNSWAIRWYASAFLKEKLTLYPGKALVKNIGFDDSGVHCGSGQEYVADISLLPVKVEKIPVVHNDFAWKIIADYFQSLKPSFFNKWFRRFKKVVKIVLRYIRNK